MASMKQQNEIRALERKLAALEERVAVLEKLLAQATRSQPRKGEKE